MFNVPKIIANPALEQFKLTEAEIYSMKEAYELINIEKYSYSLFAIWNCVIINIQRRIEEFNIDVFLKNTNEEENFNKLGTSLKNRWLNINEFKTIKSAQKLNIIDLVSYNLINMLFWMKSNTNEEEQKNIDKDEIYSILYLLEKNLFLKEFKQDMRKNTKTSNSKTQNRRDSDNEIVTTNKLNTQTLMENKVKAFEKDSIKNSDIEEHLIDKYI